MLLDDDDAVAGDFGELASLPDSSPWQIKNPHAWQLPLRAVVADGADSDAALAAKPAAARGILQATQDLEADADLIVGECGFFLSARSEGGPVSAVPALLSALDLIDFARSLTTEDIGILTYDADSLEPLIASRASRKRLRVLGLRGLPDWAAIAPSDYMERGGWTFDGMRTQLVAHLGAALAPAGEFDGIRLLILECTALPNFRDSIRAVTTLPILDVVSLTKAMLS